MFIWILRISDRDFSGRRDGKFEGGVFVDL